MKLALLGSLLTIGLATAFATTTDELKISNSGGTITATITDNGACVGTGGGCASLSGDVNSANGGITVDGSITLGAGTWTITTAGGNSNSPALKPGYGLDDFSLTAFCSGNCTGSASELDIWYSDINFTAATPAFYEFYSGSDSGAASTSLTAYWDSTNTLFGTTGTIGTVGPLLGAGGSGSVTGGGPAGPAAYSLTLYDVLKSGADGATFSTDGYVTGVPEPASLLLLGGCLLVVGRKLAARLA